MLSFPSRRRFLQTTAGSAALAGLNQWEFLTKLPRVSAEEASPNPKGATFSPDIEPLVRLLEETPREKLLEEVGARIRQGTSYREVVAALLLAGVRNIQPRPAVGFKFHAVLVVNAAHLASLSSPDQHRWLPIFWALDYFKDAQAQDVREGDWTLPPVDEGRVPPAHQARQVFIEAMDHWDEAAADVAVAALARAASAGELFEIFCRFGARDHRSIGHKAIYVANAWRTLECIGWQYAEPVLRSLAYALLSHPSEGNPAENDFPADRPGRENLARAKNIRSEWQDGKVDPQATANLLSTLYAGSPADACSQVVDMLNSGIGPQSIWDALLVGSGELLVRQPGILGLHTITTTNALRYAYGAATSDETRRWLLLQNAAFLPMFREAMQGRGGVQPTKLSELEPADATGEGDPLDKIFRQISGDREAAARLALAYARTHAEPLDFINRARLLVFFKGQDAHDYKFSSAVLEDYRHVSPAWRDRYLAASVYNLRGSEGGDNPLVERTKHALVG